MGRRFGTPPILLGGGAQFPGGFGVGFLARRGRGAVRELRRQPVDFGQARLQPRQFPFGIHPLPRLDESVGALGPITGRDQLVLQARTELVAASACLQGFASFGGAIDRPLEGLGGVPALQADLLAGVLAERPKGFDGGGGPARRGCRPLEFFLERGSFVALLLALLAQPLDVALADDQRRRHDLAIQTQEPRAVDTAAVDDLVADGTSGVGVLGDAFLRVQVALLDLDTAPIVEFELHGGAPLASAPGLVLALELTLFQGVGPAAAAPAAETGEDGLQPGRLAGLVLAVDDGHAGRQVEFAVELPELVCADAVDLHGASPLSG